MGTRTPWGISDNATKLLPGIISYSTPGHGGIHVKTSLNQQINETWRNEAGWYEEDCAWAVVAYHFPGAFKPEDRNHAINTLKNWMPYKYMAVTGKKLKPAESSTLREDIWKKAHENHLQVVCSWGDWHKKVPKGMVGVCVVKGGRLNSGQSTKADQRYFLVPAADYTLPFAIEDEKKYKEIPAIGN